MAKGHDASSPLDIPAAGWKAVAIRVWGEVGKDHVGLIAAGIAFYGLLALFPAITALMAIAGLIFEPSQIAGQIETVSAVLPQEAATIVVDQATAVTGSQDAGLGFAAAIGILLAIYSASKGMASLMEGLNVAYDEAESRGFVRRTAVTLALTVLLVVGLVLGLVANLILPAILKIVDLGDVTELLISLARWVLLGVLAVAGIGIIYRYGPARANAKWRWLTPGAIMATVLWIAASVGFSLYVGNFASYNETFGGLAGVIVLLLWLWISAYIVLLGAEVNAELEAQTASDTTTGPRREMGSRGAVKADVVESA